MNVLVTGGTGVVGRATVTELLRRGHHVRLLSRGAAEDAASWESGVAPFAADVGAADQVAGAADGCSVVLHIAAIVDESPPQLSYERINVGGTQNVLREAERAGVPRLILVSSLGAARGESDYHRSKLAAERVVARFDGSWTIARVGPVIGPRDETVSVLLRMVRALPVAPIIDSGNQQFQPIWHEDVGRALADCVERVDLDGTVLRLAGADVITVREVLDIFEDVTERSPLRIPLPAFIARFGSSLAEAVGVKGPVSAATVQMLLEGSHLQDGESNDLIERFGLSPLPIRERLVQLADALPEQLPADGVGRLRRRRFTVDINHPRITAEALLLQFCDHFAAIVPFDAVAEPGVPERLDYGATLTLDLPVRGHVQMRVEHVDGNTITLATVAGHPLAGVVRFAFQDRQPDVVRFTIDVIARAASTPDLITMALVGSRAQRRAWVQTADSVVRASGGTAPGAVDVESWDVSDEKAEPFEKWVRQLVQQRERRQENRVEIAHEDSTRQR